MTKIVTDFLNKNLMFPYFSEKNYNYIYIDFYDYVFFFYLEYICICAYELENIFKYNLNS